MRELRTVQLEDKTLISARAACYHLRFRVADSPNLIDSQNLVDSRNLTWIPGQFLSFVADTPAGKTYTRAYSLASAPTTATTTTSTTFDLCVNRVPGGFFSNLLCDLEPGAKLQCHGPHGLFSPQAPAAGGLLVAEGTGIAPFRGFLQWLFPADGPLRNEGRSFSLLYAAPGDEELFYHEEFEALARREPLFHYIPVAAAGSGAELSALREQALEQLSAKLLPPATLTEPFAQYAYLCGLAELVKPGRAQLLGLGWQRRQLLFERYD